MRIFAGYAGWSPGQLEDEIAAGGWYVVDSEARDAFTAEPDAAVAPASCAASAATSRCVATFPDDPTMN